MEILILLGKCIRCCNRRLRNGTAIFMWCIDGLRAHEVGLCILEEVTSRALRIVEPVKCRIRIECCNITADDAERVKCSDPVQVPSKRWAIVQLSNSSLSAIITGTGLSDGLKWKSQCRNLFALSASTLTVCLSWDSNRT
jgi:hypothetical protein